MSTDAGEMFPQETLSTAAVKRMEKIITHFKNEFGKRCSWEDIPKLADGSDKERDKVLISTFGFCVKQLINDAGMLEQAKAIPELESLAQTAEEFKRHLR